MEEEEEFHGDQTVESKIRKMMMNIQKKEMEIQELLREVEKKDNILYSLHIRKGELEWLKAAEQAAMNEHQGGEEDQALVGEQSPAAVDPALTPPLTFPCPGDMVQASGAWSTALEDLNLGLAILFSVQGDLVPEPAAHTPDIGDQAATLEVPCSAAGIHDLTPETRSSAEVYLALERASPYLAPEDLTCTPIVSVLPSENDTPTPTTPYPVLGEEAVEEAILLPAGEEPPPMPAAHYPVPTSLPAVPNPQSPARAVRRRHRRAKARAVKAPSPFPMPPEAEAMAPGVPNVGYQAATIEVASTAERIRGPTPESQSSAEGFLALEPATPYLAPEDQTLTPIVSVLPSENDTPTPTTPYPVLGEEATADAELLPAGEDPPLTPVAQYPVPTSPPIVCNPQSPAPSVGRRSRKAKPRAANAHLFPMPHEEEHGFFYFRSRAVTRASPAVLQKPDALLTAATEGDLQGVCKLLKKHADICGRSPETQSSAIGYLAWGWAIPYLVPKGLGPTPEVSLLPSVDDDPTPTVPNPVLGEQAAAEAVLSPAGQAPPLMPAAPYPVPAASPAPRVRRQSQKAKAPTAKAPSPFPVPPEAELAVSSTTPGVDMRIATPGVDMRIAVSVVRKSEALLTAVCEGDLYSIRKLLRKGADISYVDTEGWSALHYAAAHGMFEIVNILLAFGAPVDIKNKEECSPLAYALRIKNRETVAALVLEGALIDERGLDGSTALHQAVFKDSIDWVEFLLAVGANPNSRDSYGCTSLHIASVFNRVECVHMLLHKGAEINAQCRDKSTALHRAVAANAAECVQVLINAGANIEAKNIEGNTALHLAATWGRTDFVHALLMAKANVNAQNNKHNTALHLASIHNAVACILCLVASESNLDALNDSGDTPLLAAARAKAQDSLRVLLIFELMYSAHRRTRSQRLTPVCQHDTA